MRNRAIGRRSNDAGAFPHTDPEGRRRLGSRTPEHRAAVARDVRKWGSVQPARRRRAPVARGRTDPHLRQPLRPYLAMTPSIHQAQLLDAAGRYLAGGGLGLFVLPPELNLVIARGAGSRVWDVSGREYIDYHLSSGPALLGHAHPAITAAVSAQLPKGTTFYFLNEPEIVLAQKLVEAIPCADVVHYTGSGTEATFYALRIARARARAMRSA